MKIVVAASCVAAINKVMYRQYFTMPMLPYFFSSSTCKHCPLIFVKRVQTYSAMAVLHCRIGKCDYGMRKSTFYREHVMVSKKMKVFSNPAVALSLYKKKTHAAIIVYGTHTQALPRKLAAHDPRRKRSLLWPVPENGG